MSKKNSCFNYSGYAPFIRSFSRVQDFQSKRNSIIPKTYGGEYADMREPYPEIVSNFTSSPNPSALPITIQETRNIFSVSPALLKKTITVTKNDMLHVTFTGSISLPNNQNKEIKLEFWLGVTSSRVEPQIGILAYYLVKSYVLPFVYLLSDSVRFKRLRFNRYRRVESGDQNPVEFLSYYRESSKDKFMLPFNLRGLHTGRPPNPLALDFDLYLAETPDDRYNRFILTGAGLISDQEAYNKFGSLSADINEIQNVFLDEKPLYSGSNDTVEFQTPALKVVMYDLYGGEKQLRRVVGFSFGGLKQVANYTTKFQREEEET